MKFIALILIISFSLFVCLIPVNASAYDVTIVDNFDNEELWTFYNNDNDKISLSDNSMKISIPDASYVYAKRNLNIYTENYLITYDIYDVYSPLDDFGPVTFFNNDANSIIIRSFGDYYYFAAGSEIFFEGYVNDTNDFSIGMFRETYNNETIKTVSLVAKIVDNVSYTIASFTKYHNPCIYGNVNGPLNNVEIIINADLGSNFFCDIKNMVLRYDISSYVFEVLSEPLDYYDISDSGHYEYIIELSVYPSSCTGYTDHPNIDFYFDDGFPSFWGNPNASTTGIYHAYFQATLYGKTIYQNYTFQIVNNGFILGHAVENSFVGKDPWSLAHSNEVSLKGLDPWYDGQSVESRFKTFDLGIAPFDITKNSYTESMVWLLVMFLPIIILTVVAKFYGLCFGMGLMTVVFAFQDTSKIGILLVGVVGCVLLLINGDDD